MRWLIIIAIIVVTGFIAGFLVPPLESTTLMACPCHVNAEGEIPCNSVSSWKPVFFTGLINVVEECSGREIVVCEDGETVDTYNRLDECSYSLNVLFLLST